MKGHFSCSVQYEGGRKCGVEAVEDVDVNEREALCA